MKWTVIALALLLASACATQPSRPPEAVSMGGVVYPPDAKAKHVEGYVVVSYDVTEEGTVTNARVVESKPPGIFDDAALAAVATWKFDPAVDNGRLVTAHDVTSKIRFKLGDSEQYAR
jgi:TonB family protein